jgi:hypothetical protein
VTEYDYLVNELEKEIEARAQSVAAGNCKSIEEYRNTTGIIRGLALAVDLIKDRVQKLEDSDE